MTGRVARDTAFDVVNRSLEELHRLTSSRRIFARLMAGAGLELTRSSAAVLVQVCRTGPVSMGALAGALHLDPGATARIVAGLEETGLVQRERSASDARVNVVQASSDGHAVSARVHEAATDYLELALRDLSDDDLESCARTLVQLVAQLRALEAVTVPQQRGEHAERSPTT